MLTRVAGPKWKCERCTLLNLDLALECVACGTSRQGLGASDAVRGRFNAVGGSEDGQLRLWNTRSGSCVATLGGHRGTIWSIAVDWEEQEALTGGADRIVRLWDLFGAYETKRFVGHSGAVLCVIGSWQRPRRLVSGSTDTTARVWDMTSGECLRALVGHGGAVTALAAAWPLGVLLTATTRGDLRLWDIEDVIGCCLRVFGAHAEAIACMAARWDLDGGPPEALCGSADGTLSLWNLQTGEAVQRFAGHEGAINGMSANWAARRAVTASSDGTAKLWRLDHGTRLRTWQVRCGRGLSITADWAAGRLLCGTEEGDMQLCEIGNDWGQLRTLRQPQAGGVYCCSLEGDGVDEKWQQCLLTDQRREELFQATPAALHPLVSRARLDEKPAVLFAQRALTPAALTPGVPKRFAPKPAATARGAAPHKPAAPRAAGRQPAAPKPAAPAPGAAVPKPAAPKPAAPAPAAAVMVPRPSEPEPEGLEGGDGAAADAAEELADLRTKAMRRGMPEEDVQQAGVQELRAWLIKSSEIELLKSKELCAWRGPMADKYEAIHELGAGLEGTVRLVRERAGSRELCAKECHQEAKAAQEFQILRDMQSHNILRAVELMDGLHCRGGSWRKQAFIITEVALGGDLMHYIKSLLSASADVAITEQWLAGVHKQAMQGLAFMHERNAIHNDVKIQNILVMDAFEHEEPLRVPHVVIADLGLASRGEPATLLEGDPRYMSPEGVRAQATNAPPWAGSAADVWAMGVVLFELTSGGCLPFLYEARNLEEFFALSDAEEDEFSRKIQESALDFACCGDLSQEARDLILDLMDKEAAERPTAAEVLHDTWYSIEGRPLADSCMDRFEEVAYKGAALKMLLAALTTKLQQDHLVEARRVFAEIDEDFNLDLDEADFVDAAKALGREAPWASAAFTSAGLETLNFDHFAAMTFDWKKLDPEAVHSNLAAVIKKLDADGQGEIDLDDLDDFWDDALATDDLEDMLGKLDLVADGKVSGKALEGFLFTPKK